jgi:hypothetical protein
MSTRKLGTSFALLALSCWLSIPSHADSQARIVRLSQVDGDVQVDRNAGNGYEKAFINLPIIQGAKIRSGSDGRAEVEFEDGSTLRITPGSVVEFPGLALRDSGVRASSLNLQTGIAYLNFKGEKPVQEFSLGFGKQTLILTKTAHLRLELKDDAATVAVFKGEVQAEGPSGKVAVEKKHSATFDLAGSNPYTVANNLEPDPYDDWDKAQDKYQQQYSLAKSNSYSPYAYGASDLNYYGSFYSVPGYGMMWQPYLVGSGWDPFMNGSWMWYPNAGYTWVSAYPWGWAPYRYGSWTYLNNYGWFWRPGNSWAGWNTGPNILHPPAQFNLPKPPATPGQILTVNRGPLASPAGIVQNRIQLRDGSAGLGIARGSVRDLGKASRQVERSSFAPGALHAPSSVSAARLPASSRMPSSHGGPVPRSGSNVGAASSRGSGTSSRSSAPSSQGTIHR